MKKLILISLSFLTLLFLFSCKKQPIDFVFEPFTTEKFKQIDSIPIDAPENQGFICQGYGHPINNRGFLYTGNNLYMSYSDNNTDALNIVALKKGFLLEKYFTKDFSAYLAENTEAITEDIILSSAINYWNNCLYFGSSFDGYSIIRQNLETGQKEKLILTEAPINSLNMLNGDIYYTFGDSYKIYEIWLLKNGKKRT